MALTEQEELELLELEEQESRLASQEQPQQVQQGQPQGNVLQQLLQAFKNTGEGIVNPPYRIAAHTLQGLESLVRGGQATTYKNPITNDVVEPYAQGTPINEPIGLGMQGGAMFLSPGLGGAMVGAGGAVQAGKSPMQVVGSGLLGAVIGKTLGMFAGEPLVTSRIAKKGADFVAKRFEESAEKQYQKALGVTTQSEKDLLKGIMPTLLEKKPVALTRSGLKRAAERRENAIGEVLEQAYKELPANTRFDASQVVKTIQNKQKSLEINGVVPQTSMGEYNALTNLTDDFLAVTKTSQVAPETIRAYRQVMDRAIEASKKGFSMTGRGGGKLMAQRELANGIRREFAKQYPSIANINKEFHFWSTMSDVLEKTVGKGKPIMDNVGFVIGLVSHDPVTGVLLSDLGKVMSSNTMWNSISASNKARIAEMLSTGQTTEARITFLGAVSRLGKSRSK